MMHIIDLSEKFPADWNDDKKYPNKRLDYTTADKLKEIHKVCERVNGYKIDVKSMFYPEFIHELWIYDNPNNQITGLGTVNVVKCPYCGSYNVKKEQYDTLCPEMLAGSAGMKYTCEDCGCNCYEAHIMS